MNDHNKDMQLEIVELFLAQKKLARLARVAVQHRAVQSYSWKLYFESIEACNSQL